MLHESSEAIMELHEDDPEHFEFVLKFIYTGAYDKHEITKLAGDDKNKRVLVPIGVHAIADKYDIAKLYKPAAEDVKAVLLEAVKDQVMIVDAIRAYYSTQVNADGSMGRLITSVIFEKYGDFVHTEEFERLLLANPTFATDVALHYQRNKVLRVAGRAQCQSCKLQAVDIGIMRTRGMVSFHCPLCMLKQSLPAHGKN
ncbi:hypothetical protein J4E81_000869 [Alternaria sp. BMP 2799]|nr:hypothetical protein J4E81_000869 [Alternaria sp. BMP 2799]